MLTELCIEKYKEVDGLSRSYTTMNEVQVAGCRRGEAESIRGSLTPEFTERGTDTPT